MTNIRELMLNIINIGVSAWIDAQFAGNNTPADSLTGYPLTLETSRVYYRPDRPYSVIEREYLESVGGVTEFSAQEMQEWAVYHWKHAHLELAEDFTNVRPVVTPEMLERREQIKESMYEQGYRLVQS